MPKPRHLVLLIAMATSLVGCGGRASPSTAPPAADQSLSGLAAQRVVLLPTYTVRVATDLPWGTTVGRSRDLQAALDSALVSALRERNVGRTWTLPEALAQSYKRNSTYAADPYALAEEPLRSPSLEIAARIAEPLGSQLRTMVALHDEARLVLAPVELRFERAGANAGRAALRLVLVDARANDVRWIGQVVSDSASAYSPALLKSVAAKFGDLFGEKR